MICVRVFLLVFLMVVAGRLSAGEAEADFAISASVAPGGVMPPGTEGVVTITLTNLGPNDGSPLFSMQTTDDGTGFFSFPPLQFRFPEAFLAGPCVSGPFQLPPSNEFLTWVVLDMTAGQSVECMYAFTVVETSKISQVGRWTVERFSGPGDSNDANNIADVLLRFAESPEPVSVTVLSPWAVIILALLLGLIAPYGLAKRSKSSARSY